MLKIKFGVIVLSSLIIFLFIILAPKHNRNKTTFQPVHYSGAVLPHHLLAKSFIDDFISKINYLPEKIYIIGPNHPEVGNALVITNQNSETDQLLKLNFVSSNNQIISDEHSVKVFQEILAPIYPQSQIIPLIISSKLSASDIEELVNYLSKNSNDKTLIICSTDFSHYRTLDEADNFDQKTLSLISQKKYSDLFNLNNNYIDSSKSLMIVLKTLEKLNKNNLTVINHSNSAIINHDLNAVSTTSYFELAFE